MPHTIKRFEEGNLIIAAFDGLVEGRDILAALEEVGRIARTGTLPRLVWDCRETTCLAIGPSQLDRLVARATALEDTFGTGRTAFVATRGVDTDLAALFITVTHESPRERYIFSGMDRALAWLFDEAAHGLEAEGIGAPSKGMTGLETPGLEAPVQVTSRADSEPLGMEALRSDRDAAACRADARRAENGE